MNDPKYPEGRSPRSAPRDPSAPDKTVLSPSNALVGEWRDSLSSKGIRKHGQFIVAGRRAVNETLERFPALARSLFICADRHAPSAAQLDSPVATLMARARTVTANNDPRFSVIALGREIFDELDVSGTHEPMLLTRTPDVADADLSRAPVGLEILCALGDPSNVGALLRSAAAFGVAKVILLKECASPFHPKAVRAASAASLMTKLERGPSIKDLPAHSAAQLAGPVLALDMRGKNISTFSWPTNARLLVGEEGQGVPSSSTFEYLSIPMAADVESLNATVATSIALFSYASR